MAYTINVIEEKGIGCSICTRICPTGTLTMDKEAKKAYNSGVFCDNAWGCIYACPAQALEIIEEKTMQEIKDYGQVAEVINQDLVMIIAKTHTCSTCTTINDIIAQNVKYIDELPVYYLYVDDMAEFRGEYTIFSVPTVLIFNEGKEILRESKFINFAKIDRLIDMFKH